MKVMGQGMLVGNGVGRASPTELLQFNLSQPVASVIIDHLDARRTELVEDGTILWSMQEIVNALGLDRPDTGQRR